MGSASGFVGLKAVQALGISFLGKDQKFLLGFSKIFPHLEKNPCKTLLPLNSVFRVKA